YTPSGGSVSVQIVPDQRGVRFSVVDTGVGVSKADQRDIFKTFFRTEAARAADTEGVGLGLSLVKNTIERQGGTVGVLSEGAGKGSTFWFTLPAAPIPPPASP
ncbi:MAG: sensor histidine kinase, partial [Minisyncoccia bacterium]